MDLRFSSGHTLVVPDTRPRLARSPQDIRWSCPIPGPVLRGRRQAALPGCAAAARAWEEPFDGWRPALTRQDPGHAANQAYLRCAGNLVEAARRTPGMLRCQVGPRAPDRFRSVNLESGGFAAIGH